MTASSSRPQDICSFATTTVESIVIPVMNVPSGTNTMEQFLLNLTLIFSLTLA
jgi:hypothetical protein